MRSILLVCSHTVTGIQYYRQLMPHKYLKDNSDIDVGKIICDVDQFDNVPDDILKGFDLIQFARQISIKGDTDRYVKRCHKLGLKVVFD